MDEETHVPWQESEKPIESGMAQALTLAATVAMLGVSLGVNVPQLLAGSPGDAKQADQPKLGGIQSKESAVQSKVPAIQDKRVITQKKLPAMQQKQPVTPGVKPIDPPR